MHLISNECFIEGKIRKGTISRLYIFSLFKSRNCSNGVYQKKTLKLGIDMSCVKKYILKIINLF